MFRPVLIFGNIDVATVLAELSAHTHTHRYRRPHDHHAHMQPADRTMLMDYLLLDNCFDRTPKNKNKIFHLQTKRNEKQKIESFSLLFVSVAHDCLLAT